MTSGKLSGRVSVVTGAAMGNGEGIARVAVEYGAHVLLWDISDQVFKTTELLRSEGYKATPYKVDVTKLRIAEQRWTTPFLISEKSTS